MSQVHGYIGQNPNGKHSQRSDFVLEKGIFSNIFEKDIRRVFIYKKAERIAKAMSLIAPAFAANVSLKTRVEASTLALIDAAMRAPSEIRTVLARELLALSSIIAVARTAGTLSEMNADIILHEAQVLLDEVTGYEDRALVLEEVPSIALLAKHSPSKDAPARREHAPQQNVLDKGHVKDIKKETEGNKDRKSIILELIKRKGKASIKDISTVVRGVSEKTVQRELAALIESGIVIKTGERRWSLYALA